MKEEIKVKVLFSREEEKKVVCILKSPSSILEESSALLFLLLLQGDEYLVQLPSAREKKRGLLGEGGFTHVSRKPHFQREKEEDESERGDAFESAKSPELLRLFFSA